MIAVIQTGGKQYLIKTGDSLKIEKLPVKQGDKFVFDKVLLIANDDGSEVKVGSPYLSEVVVEVTVEKQGRCRKIRAAKFKRKTRKHVVIGHRQSYSQVKVS